MIQVTDRNSYYNVTVENVDIDALPILVIIHWSLARHKRKLKKINENSFNFIFCVHMLKIENGYSELGSDKAVASKYH